MSSESGQRLSMEELQRLNPPPHPVPPIIQAAQSQAVQKTKRDWDDLLTSVSALCRLERINSDRLERLEASVAAQEALFRALSRQVGQLPTQSQLEALARDVAQMRAELKQAGKKKEKHSCKWLDWLPDFDLIVVAKWIVLVLLIVAALLGMGYGTATVVSNIRNLFL